VPAAAAGLAHLQAGTEVCSLTTDPFTDRNPQQSQTGADVPLFVVFCDETGIMLALGGSGI